MNEELGSLGLGVEMAIGEGIWGAATVFLGTSPAHRSVFGGVLLTL